MTACPQCGVPYLPDGRFCGRCGRPRHGGERPVRRSLPPREVRSGQPFDYRFEEVMAQRDKRLGAIGVLLVFLGAFLPWAYASYSAWFITVSANVGSPYVWLSLIASAISAVLLLKRNTGTLMMVLGGVICALVIAFLASTVSGTGWSGQMGYSAPSLGAFATLAGGGLMVYSGWMTNLYRG